MASCRRRQIQMIFNSWWLFGLWRAVKHRCGDHRGNSQDWSESWMLMLSFASGAPPLLLKLRNYCIRPPVAYDIFMSRWYLFNDVIGLLVSITVKQTFLFYTQNIFYKISWSLKWLSHKVEVDNTKTEPLKGVKVISMSNQCPIIKRFWVFKLLNDP